VTDTNYRWTLIGSQTIVTDECILMDILIRFEQIAEVFNKRRFGYTRKTTTAEKKF